MLVVWLLAGCMGSVPSEQAAPVPEAPPVPSDRPGLCEGDGSRDCFVELPGGSFLMGAQATAPDQPGYDPAARPEEGPPRQVTVGPLQVLRTEASVALFERCVAAGACAPASVSTGGYSNFGEPTRRAHPINGITWEGARALCAWMGGRLPREAEWEYAARGPEGRRFPWGSDPTCPIRAAAGSPEAASKDTPIPPGCGRIAMLLPRALSEARSQEVMGALHGRWTEPELAALCADLDARTDAEAPALFAERVIAGPRTDRPPPPPLDCLQEGTVTAADLRNDGVFGLIGMGGNVAEWVEEAWDSSAPQTPSTPRVQRGGSWVSGDPLDFRSAARGALPGDLQLNDVGVRCVRELP